MKTIVLGIMACCMLCAAASQAKAQLVMRRGCTSSGLMYMESGGASLQGFVTGGLPIAGMVTTGTPQPDSNTYGWLGFFPVAQRTAPVHVHDYSVSTLIWPQPAHTRVYVRGVQVQGGDVWHSGGMERGLPTRVVVADVFGRETSLPIQWIESDVVSIDVSGLAVGTYVVRLGRGLIVRIGNQP